MKKAFLFILLSPAPLFAQAQLEVTWTQSAQQPQSYTYKLYVTPREANVVNPPITLINVSCGGAQCAAALPKEAYNAALDGVKSQLTATDAAGNESALSDPFYGAGGCVFENTFFALADFVARTTNKNNLEKLINDFGAAGFDIVQILKLTKNTYQVTGTCVGEQLLHDSRALAAQAEKLTETGGYNSPVEDPYSQPPIRY
jgi:hypothetical protein